MATRKMFYPLEIMTLVMLPAQVAGYQTLGSMATAMCQPFEPSELVTLVRVPANVAGHQPLGSMATAMGQLFNN